MTPDATLKVVPLGGLGHVGGNMMAYETHDDLIVVDCGVLFPTPEQPGVDYVIPDISYLLQRRKKFRGYLLTHGHEDHIGALPFVLPELEGPIYGTALTLDLVRNRLGEHPALDPKLVEIKDGQRFSVGGFEIETIPVTHSIPSAVALAIETPVGTIIHTGDFRFDPTPPDGRITDSDAFRRFGGSGVVALFSDSTNAERSGHTWSEREVADVLTELVASSDQRVFVTTFASNFHRLQAIIDATEQAGRKLLAVGRSVQQNIQMGLERGYLTARNGSPLKPDDFDRVPASKLTVIASGSQGEPRSAMTRIAAGRHGRVSIEAGDRVILSARRIPGNERAVSNMVNNLYRMGAEVIDDRIARVHTSGHAFNDEQRQMLEMCKPRFFVPIHGEYRHLIRHAALAEEAGIPSSRICVVEDGHPIEITRADDELSIHVGEYESAGEICVDGKGVGDVDDVVLKDRRILSSTGVVICVVLLDERGAPLQAPEITTRGVIHVDHRRPLLDKAIAEVRRAIEKSGNVVDVGDCSEQIRVTLRRFFRRELGRRPLVLPVVISLE